MLVLVCAKRMDDESPNALRHTGSGMQSAA